MKSTALRNLDLPRTVCCRCNAAGRLLLVAVAASIAAAIAALAVAAADAAHVASAAAIRPVARQQALVLGALRPAVNLTRPHDGQWVAERTRLRVAQVPAKYAVLGGFIIRPSLRNTAATRPCAASQQACQGKAHLQWSTDTDLRKP